MSETLIVNSNISHYRILRKLGAGGMGEVFLAEDTRLRRKIALKVLPESIAQDKDRLRRFEQEAFAASALNHPNILTIHEFGAENGCHFLASEFVEGETLRERLKADDLSLKETVGVAEQIAFALAAAHAAGIVHRDIKPENIMLRRNDQIVKVLDFGLAKLTEKKTENPDVEAETRALVQTNPGVIMGTVSYMSPEQARGKDTDARTDIFSLGILMYEMLARRLPFQGETISDVIAAILQNEPLPPTDFNSEIPFELERIVLKTLAKDREERYQTAKDLLVDLRRLKRQIEIGAEIKQTKPPVRSFENSPENATEILAPRPTSSAEYVTGEVKKHKLAFLLLSVILLAAIGAVGVWYFNNRQANTRQIESIAVLPFENASGNADLDYLSDGVSESVIDRLSQLPQLKVIARSSSFRYKGQNLNLQEIADALGVDAVLTGRVVQRGDSYQIRIEIIDGRDNHNLWSETFNRKASDLQVLQTDISREIAENLRFKLSGKQTHQTAKQTANPQAYELVLKGEFYRNKGGAENNRKAVEYFQQAIVIDPNYALAYARLADTFRGGDGNPKETLPRREATIRRALELDPNLAEAHFDMGQYQRDLWNWQEAEKSYRRAMQLNPNYAHAYSGLSGLLSLLGRHEEAIAADKRATELDPVGIIVNTVAGRTFYYARRYDEAIEQLKKTIEFDRSSPTARRVLGDIYFSKGMYAEALAEYELTIKLGGAADGTQGRLGAAYAKTGERERALEILKRLQSDGGNMPPNQLAILYAALGDNEQALTTLEKAYAERSPSLQFLKVNPLYDDLRSDPRFQDLLRRMNLPQ